MSTKQLFKAIYFKDYRQVNPRSKSYTIAFGQKQSDIYKKLENYDSEAIRSLLDTDSYIELENRALAEGLSVNTYSLWYIRKKLEILKNHSSSYTPKDNIRNQILEGDCLEIMSLIPDKSVDMVLCDPPYGTTQNKWDSPIALDKLWEQYERIIKDNGVIVLTAQGLFSAMLMLSNQNWFKYKITWLKSKPTNFLNAKKQPLRRHEDLLVFYKKQPTYNPQMTAGEPYNKGFRKNQLTGSYGVFKSSEVKSDGKRYPTDTIYFKTAESEGPVFHPTQKPVELGRYLIRTYTNEGDIVLDNTCGSGSFLVAAVLEGRDFIGIELNKETYLFKDKKIDYIEICKNRVSKAQEEYKLLTNTLF